LSRHGSRIAAPREDADERVAGDGGAGLSIFCSRTSTRRQDEGASTLAAGTSWRSTRTRSRRFCGNRLLFQMFSFRRTVDSARSEFAVSHPFRRERGKDGARNMVLISILRRPPCGNLRAGDFCLLAMLPIQPLPRPKSGTLLPADRRRQRCRLCFRL